MDTVLANAGVAIVTGKVPPVTSSSGIATSSPAVGTAPISQFDATLHKPPPGLIQSTTMGAVMVMVNVAKPVSLFGAKLLSTCAIYVNVSVWPPARKLKALSATLYAQV